MKFTCNICGFPHSGMMGKIKTNIGRMAIQGIDKESLKNHFLEHHPHEYKGLLKELEVIRRWIWKNKKIYNNLLSEYE